MISLDEENKGDTDVIYEVSNDIIRTINGHMSTKKVTVSHALSALSSVMRVVGRQNGISMARIICLLIHNTLKDIPYEQKTK